MIMRGESFKKDGKSGGPKDAADKKKEAEKPVPKKEDVKEAS